jgi:choline dehydrogenase-like flavoprotein
MNADVLIIGAGAGGGALAYRLAASGKRVLLLERGGWLPREAGNWDPEALFGREQRYASREAWVDGASGDALSGSAYYHVGGNTKVYGAALLRLRPEDFEEHRTHDGMAPAWPISYADLGPYYDEAERVYHVHGLRGSDPFEPPAGGEFPHPPLAHEPRIAEVAEGLRKLDIRAFELPMGVRRNEDDDDDGPFVLRETFEAAGRETFDGYPDLTGLKADAETATVRPALRQPGVEIRTNVRVTRIETSASGREVVAVVAEVDGVEERFTAGVYVLAAGAINSAALLLRSGSDHHPRGLANGSGAVGRHFMRHVSSKFYSIAPGVPNESYFQKTLAINDFYFSGPEEDYPLGHIHLMGKHYGPMIARDLAITAEEAAPLATNSVDWWVQSEDLPLYENRVELDASGRIVLHYSDSNTVPHERLMDVMQARLGEIGFKTFFRVPMPLYVVNHQCGTLRMGTDPATSVLDPLCRAHDLANLYAVDASVFPSSGASNPTLTIVANAFRVADHLMDEVL